MSATRPVADILDILDRDVNAAQSIGDAGLAELKAGPAVSACGGACPTAVPDPGWSVARFLPTRLAVSHAFLGSGREALAWVLLGLGAAGRVVLVPAFGCAALAHGVRLAGAEPRFYPGDECLLPDRAVLRGLARDPRVAAVLLVHAFGRVQEPIALGASIPVIEDASHTVCNAAGMRYLGPGASAALVASLRKQLPVGAGLGVRWDGGPVVPCPRRPSVAALAFSRARAASADQAGPRQAAWLAAAEDVLDRPLPPDASHRNGYGVGAPVAAARRRLDRMAVSDWAALPAWRARCRENWHALDTALRGTEGVRPLHASLPAGVCPLGYVIRHPDRSRLARRLWRRGVVTTWHWPVSAEARPYLTRAERMLAGTILTLPCDGGYDAAAIAWLAAAVIEEA